jgi:hypothetical protein
MAFIFLKEHEQIINEVRRSLITIGVPADRILCNRRIDIPGWHQADADLLVVGEDGKTIICQIEAKVSGGDVKRAYQQARRSFARVWNFHKCFVAIFKGDEFFIGRVAEGDSDCVWTKVEDAKAMLDLIGDYQNESNLAIEKARESRKKIIEQECEVFTRGLWIAGALLLIAAVICELLEKEFSWKIYYLITLVFAIYAAANGLVVHIKVGQGEVMIGKRSEKSHSKKEFK